MAVVKRLLSALQGFGLLIITPVVLFMAWLHYARRFGWVLPFDPRPALDALEGAWRLLCAGLLAIPVWVMALSISHRLKERQRKENIAKAVACGPTIALLPRSDWKSVNPEDVQLWARLAEALPHDEPISFELGGDELESCFALHGSLAGLRAAYTQVKAEWPLVQRRPFDAGENSDPALLPEGWQLWWCECTPQTWDKPIQVLSDDPLRSLLVELAGVTGQGRGLVQIIAQRDFGTRKRLGQAAFAARDEEIPSKGVRAIRTQEAKELERRARGTFLQVTLRAVGMADTLERAQGIARGLGRSLASSFSHSNPVRVVAEGQGAERVAGRALGKMGVWSADELAWLGHLPGGDMLQVAPRLQSASANALPADPEMRIGHEHLTVRIA